MSIRSTWFQRESRRRRALTVLEGRAVPKLDYFPPCSSTRHVEIVMAKVGFEPKLFRTGVTVVEVTPEFGGNDCVATGKEHGYRPAKFRQPRARWVFIPKDCSHRKERHVLLR